MRAYFSKAQADLGLLSFYFSWEPPGRGGGVRGARRRRASWEFPMAAVGRGAGGFSVCSLFFQSPTQALVLLGSSCFRKNMWGNQSARVCVRKWSGSLRLAGQPPCSHARVQAATLTPHPAMLCGPRGARPERGRGVPPLSTAPPLLGQSPGAVTQGVAGNWKGSHCSASGTRGTTWRLQRHHGWRVQGAGGKAESCTAVLSSPLVGGPILDRAVRPLPQRTPAGPPRRRGPWD